MATREEILRARIELVERHVRSENLHDLEAIMETFGEAARYDDEPWGDHRVGRHGVRSYYEELIRALPDLRIDVQRRHVSDDYVVLEVEISGTQKGEWRGLPGTGRRVSFPLCAVYSFDDKQKLAGEKIYYDRATSLSQVGLFHDPSTLLGQITTPIFHPITVVKALARSLLRRWLGDSSEPKH
ncbi:MAG TPA: ester cyclase [Candidatus Binatia bacterium]|nr:ester cyclase [Candidatus Binatia bacterium]